MEILRKALKIVGLLFVIFIVMLSIMIFTDTDLGPKYNQIFINMFMLILVSFLLIGAILSFTSIIKYAKKDFKGFIKSFVLRLVVLLAISFGADYLKSKEIDIGDGLAYSIMLTIGSFYLQDRFMEE